MSLRVQLLIRILDSTDRSSTRIWRVLPQASGEATARGREEKSKGKFVLRLLAHANLLTDRVLVAIYSKLRLPILDKKNERKHSLHQRRKRRGQRSVQKTRRRRRSERGRKRKLLRTLESRHGFESDSGFEEEVVVFFRIALFPFVSFSRS